MSTPTYSWLTNGTYDVSPVALSGFVLPSPGGSYRQNQVVFTTQPSTPQNQVVFTTNQVFFNTNSEEEKEFSACDMSISTVATEFPSCIDIDFDNLDMDEECADPDNWLKHISPIKLDFGLSADAEVFVPFTMNPLAKVFRPFEFDANASTFILNPEDDTQESFISEAPTFDWNVHEALDEEEESLPILIDDLNNIVMDFVAPDTRSLGEILTQDGAFTCVELVANWEDFVIPTVDENKNCLLECVSDLCLDIHQEQEKIITDRGFATPADLHYYAQSLVVDNDHEEFDYSIVLFRDNGKLLFDTNPEKSQKVVLIATENHLNRLDFAGYFTERCFPNETVFMSDVLCDVLGVDDPYEVENTTDTQYFEAGLVWNGDIQDNFVDLEETKEWVPQRRNFAVRLMTDGVEERKDQIETGDFFEVTLTDDWETYVIPCDGVENCVVEAFQYNIMPAVAHLRVAEINARGYASPIDLEWYSENMNMAVPDSVSITMVDESGQIIFDVFPERPVKFVLVQQGTHVMRLEEAGYVVHTSHNYHPMWEVVAEVMDVPEELVYQLLPEDFIEFNYVWNGKIEVYEDDVTEQEYEDDYRMMFEGCTWKDGKVSRTISSLDDIYICEEEYENEDGSIIPNIDDIEFCDECYSGDEAEEEKADIDVTPCKLSGEDFNVVIPTIKVFGRIQDNRPKTEPRFTGRAGPCPVRPKKVLRPRPKMSAKPAKVAKCVLVHEQPMSVMGMPVIDEDTYFGPEGRVKENFDQQWRPNGPLEIVEEDLDFDGHWMERDEVVDSEIAQLGMAMYEADLNMECQVSMDDNWEMFVQPNNSNGFCVSQAVKQFTTVKAMTFKPTMMDIIDIADKCFVQGQPASIVMISRFGKLICQTHPTRRQKIVLMCENNHCALVSRGYSVVPGKGCTVEQYISEHFNMYEDEVCLLIRTDLINAGLWLGMNTDDLSHADRVKLDKVMTAEERLELAVSRAKMPSASEAVLNKMFRDADWLEELLHSTPPSHADFNEMMHQLEGPEDFLSNFLTMPLDEFFELSIREQRFAIAAHLNWYNMGHQNNFATAWNFVSQYLELQMESRRDDFNMHLLEAIDALSLVTERPVAANILLRENIYADVDMTWTELYNQIAYYLSVNEMESMLPVIRRRWSDRGISVRKISGLSKGNQERMMYQGRWLNPGENVGLRRVAVPINEIKFTVVSPTNTHETIAKDLQQKKAEKAFRARRSAERVKELAMQEEAFAARLLADIKAKEEKEMDDELASMFAEAEADMKETDSDEELRLAEEEIAASEAADEARERMALLPSQQVFQTPTLAQRRVNMVRKTGAAPKKMVRTARAIRSPAVGTVARHAVTSMAVRQVPLKRPVRRVNRLAKPIIRRHDDVRAPTFDSLPVGQGGSLPLGGALKKKKKVSITPGEIIRDNEEEKEEEEVRVPVKKMSADLESMFASLGKAEKRDRTVHVPKKKVMRRRPPVIQPTTAPAVLLEEPTVEREVVRKKVKKIEDGIFMSKQFNKEAHEAKEKEPEFDLDALPDFEDSDEDEPIAPKSKEQVQKEFKDFFEPPPAPLINEPKVQEQEPVTVDLELDTIRKQFGKAKNAGQYLSTKLGKLRTQLKKNLQERGDTDDEVTVILHKVKNASAEVMPLAEQELGLRVGQVKEALNQIRLSKQAKAAAPAAPAHIAELFNAVPAMQESDDEIRKLKANLAFDGPLVDSPAYGWSEKTSRGKDLTAVQMAKKQKAAENKRAKDVKKLARLEKEGARKLKAKRNKNEIMNDRMMKAKPKGKQPEKSLMKPKPVARIPLAVPAVAAKPTTPKKVNQQSENLLEFDPEAMKKQEHEKIEYDPEIHDPNFKPNEAHNIRQVDFAKPVPGKAFHNTGLNIPLVKPVGIARGSNLKASIQQKLKANIPLSDQEKAFHRTLMAEAHSKVVPDRAGLVLRPEQPKFKVKESVAPSGKAVMLGKKSDVRASWNALGNGKPKVGEINNWIRENIGIAQLPKGFKLGKSKKVDKMNMVEAWLDETNPRTAIKDSFLERARQMEINGANKQEWYLMYRELVPLQSDRVPIKEFKSKNAVHNVVMDLVEAGRRPPKHTTSRAAFVKPSGPSTEERLANMAVEQGKAMKTQLEQKKAVKLSGVEIEPLPFDEAFRPQMQPAVVEKNVDNRTWAELKKPSKREAPVRALSKFEGEETQLTREGEIRRKAMEDASVQMEQAFQERIMKINSDAHRRSKKHQQNVLAKAQRTHQADIDTAGTRAVIQDRLDRKQQLKDQGIDLDRLAEQPFVPFAADEEEQFIPEPLPVGPISPDFGPQSPEIDYNKTPSPVQMKHLDLNNLFNLDTDDFVPVPMQLPNEEVRELELPKNNFSTDVIGFEDSDDEEDVIEPMMIPVDMIAEIAEKELLHRTAKAEKKKIVSDIIDVPAEQVFQKPIVPRNLKPMKTIKKVGRNSDVTPEQLNKFNLIVNRLSIQVHESAAYVASRLLTEMDDNGLTYQGIIKLYSNPKKTVPGHRR